MSESTPVIRLEDYRASDWLIETVDLLVKLEPHAAWVEAGLAIRPNPAGRPGMPLVLDGDALQLVSLAVNGKPLPPDAYEANPQRLVLPHPPAGAFTLQMVTVLDPSANTRLMGLYRSNGIYCTQCEAEGFRRITYFLDRPDVLSIYTTRIEASRDEAPVLLGNGNPVAQGGLPDGRHFAVWHDPHPKPAYLFALVGGRLGHVSKDYVTGSGRKVALGVYVETGKEDRADYALEALERSMRWDEETFGREYDLDVFNIVAVSDFNMGAMENKGLNIFNDRYVLASQQTATDLDYAYIEAIIAHEYFHNWTGNRITCRDWFQLCLKEGLTVFRDQEFTSDQRSRAVKRIADVRALRAAQFSEDSGPLAHPVRPTAYREINNFYTATVYEKGAEIVRMLKMLLGARDFRRGMDLYFERCDGTAATVEDFLACFEKISGRDLSQFGKWYAQAGTPVVFARGSYDASGRRYTLELTQSTPPTPGQPHKEPMVIPIGLGLLLRDGSALELEGGPPETARGFVVLDKMAASFTFDHIPSEPVPSLLRGFSAPVRLEAGLGEDDLLVLFRHDCDPFNRWQAAQSYAMRLLLRGVEAIKRQETPPQDPRFAEALRALLVRESDHAFAAQVLNLPGETDLAREIGTDIDPDAVFCARRALRQTVGASLSDDLALLHDRLACSLPYSPDATNTGRRALRNAALDLLAAGTPAQGEMLAAAQFRNADNMTDRLAALAALCQVPGKAREDALTAFATAHRSDPLVLDKWLALQASIPEPETLDRIRTLMTLPGFSLANPNRVRALIGTFAMSNLSQFHRADGAGYAFIADIVVRLDATNPQIAARLLSSFKTWRSLEPGRRALSEVQLQRVAARQGLSRDLSDIVTRALAPS